MGHIWRFRSVGRRAPEEETLFPSRRISPALTYYPPACPPQPPLERLPRWSIRWRLGGAQRGEGGGEVVGGRDPRRRGRRRPPYREGLCPGRGGERGQDRGDSDRDSKVYPLPTTTLFSPPHRCAAQRGCRGDFLFSSPAPAATHPYLTQTPPLSHSGQQRTGGGQLPPSGTLAGSRSHSRVRRYAEARPHQLVRTWRGPIGRCGTSAATASRTSSQTV